LALVAASGCSQIKSPWNNHKPQKATTNSTQIKNSPYSTTFKEATYETIQADGRDFVLTERNQKSNIQYSEKSVSNVLDEQMVPLDNSQRIRTPSHVEFRPKGEKYFLANGFFDDSGALNINHDSETRESFFVLEKRIYDEKPTAEILSSVQRRVIERLTKEKPGAKFNDTKYINVVIANKFGPDKVLIDRTELTPKIMEDSTRNEDGSVTTTYRFGVVAVGYIPTTGTEVAKPFPEKPEEQRVIEGMPNPN